MPGVSRPSCGRNPARWEQFGPELLRLKDRHERDFCLGPTHEEVITDIARREIKSYRQLPVNFYQIQTKFRDEIRPRFGVMRAREFLMKDAYSFHLDQESLQAGYDAMHKAYTRIFTRLGLEFRAVEADTGAIGGSGSQEFHVLADSGEDAIAFSDGDDYAANVEMAEALPPAAPRAAASRSRCTEVATPGAKTIEDVTRVAETAGPQLREDFVRRRQPTAAWWRCWCAAITSSTRSRRRSSPGVAKPAAHVVERRRSPAATGAEAGFLGPVGFKGRIYADHSVVALADFVCGANEKDAHLTGVNWGRDLPEADRGRHPQRRAQATRRRRARARCRSRAASKSATSSSSAGSTASPWAPRCSTKPARPATLYMGCYGIGVTRVVAAAIEQNHDARGIIWPDAIAPFQW